MIRGRFAPRRWKKAKKIGTRGRYDVYMVTEYIGIRRVRHYKEYIPRRIPQKEFVTPYIQKRTKRKGSTALRHEQEKKPNYAYVKPHTRKRDRPYEKEVRKIKPKKRKKTKRVYYTKNTLKSI